MTKSLRFLMLGAFALATLTACNDGTDPIAVADVAVMAYVDADESGAFNTGDAPIEGATVTLAMTGAATPLTATTGSDGIAAFDDVAAGSYTASIELPAAMTGVTLASATTPTVTVEEDADATAEFRYTYDPGTVEGRVYNDQDGTEGYDPASDTPGEDFEVSLIAGTDMTGDTMAVDTTDGDGLYSFGTVMHGDYTVAVSAPAGVAMESDTAIVSVAGGATVTANFVYDIELATIAEARDLPSGGLAIITGVAITGTDTTEAGEEALGSLSTSTFYMQNGGAGIAVYMPSSVREAFPIGDSVTIVGMRGAFNDEVQLSASGVTVHGAGTMPAAVAITAAELNAGAQQGELVVLQDVVVDSITGNFDENIWVSAVGSDVPAHVYLDVDAQIDGAATFTVGNTYTITGVAARYRDDFEVKPRMPSDVVAQ